MKESQIHFISFEKEKRINFFQSETRHEKRATSFLLLHLSKNCEKSKDREYVLQASIIGFENCSSFLTVMSCSEKNQKDLMIKLRL
jgi:hypothetical protein